MKIFILAVLISIIGAKHLLVETQDDDSEDLGSDYARPRQEGGEDDMVDDTARTTESLTTEPLKVSDCKVKNT